MEFKDLVNKRREQLGLTMEELGTKVGVSKATIQRWESGEIKNVRRDKIAKLANALETTPAYLMGWENESDNIEENTDKNFTDPVEAFKYILDTPLMMAYGGYDVSKMTDQELVDFANEIADYAKYIAERKYSKK